MPTDAAPDRRTSILPLDDAQAPVVYLLMLHVEQNRRKHPPMLVTQLEALSHPWPGAEPIRKLWEFKLARMAQHPQSQADLSGTIKPTEEGRAFLVRERHRILTTLDERADTHNLDAATIRKRKNAHEPSAREQERRASLLILLKERIERLQREVLTDMPLTTEQQHDLQQDAAKAAVLPAPATSPVPPPAEVRLERTPPKPANDGTPLRPMLTPENVRDWVTTRPHKVRRGDVAEYFGCKDNAKALTEALTPENGLEIGHGGWIVVKASEGAGVGDEPQARG